MRGPQGSINFHAGVGRVLRLVIPEWHLPARSRRPYSQRSIAAAGITTKRSRKPSRHGIDNAGVCCDAITPSLKGRTDEVRPFCLRAYPDLYERSQTAAARRACRIKVRPSLVKVRVTPA